MNFLSVLWLTIFYCQHEGVYLGYISEFSKAYLEKLAEHGSICLKRFELRKKAAQKTMHLKLH